MVEPNPLEVIRNAIVMEVEGKDFFQKAVDTVGHKKAKDTFVSLIKQEERHIDVLEDQLNHLIHDKRWAPLEEIKNEAPTYPRLSVFQDKEIKHIRLDPNAGELEVLKLAIEVERKSIEYYREAGIQIPDPHAKEIFNWLVGEEAGHLTVLNAEYDYRTKSGYYYYDAEFSLEVM